MSHDKNNNINVVTNDAESSDEDTSCESHDEDRVTWTKFMSILIKITKERLVNVRSNLKRNYRLTQKEIDVIDSNFNNTDEYDNLLKEHFVKFINSKDFDNSEDSMLNFMDISNVLVRQVIELKLRGVNGKLNLPTKWYQQKVRDKIIRQESKMTSSVVENHICATVYVCKENSVYSEYLKDWLRLLLDSSRQQLSTFFNTVPDVLEKHKHSVKSSQRLRKTIKNIINSENTQKDIIDFLDEVITNRDTVMSVVPQEQKKSVELLKNLFTAIDSTYDVNVNNGEKLEHITDILKDWIDVKQNIDISLFFISVIENMKLNFKIWPLKVQNNINYIWSEIIML